MTTTRSDANQTDSVSQIDFDEYRTPELISAISQVTTVGDKIGQVAITAAVGVLAFFLITAGALYPNAPIAVSTGMSLYAVVAGALAGAVFGVAESIRRQGENMLAVIDLLLEETAIVARDLRRWGSGTHELPPAGQLVDTVYHRLLFPIVEDSVSGNLGWIGRPGLWLYRRTLDRLVRVVIRRVIPDTLWSPGEPDAARSSVVKDLPLSVEQEDAISSWLIWTRDRVASITGWLKRLIALPCYAVSAVIFLLAIQPIIIAWYLWATGPADADGVSPAAGTMSAFLLSNL